MTILDVWRARTGRRQPIAEHLRQQQAVGQHVSLIPGEALQEAGVDQPPSPRCCDETAEAAERLIGLHGWSDAS